MARSKKVVGDAEVLNEVLEETPAQKKERLLQEIQDAAGNFKKLVKIRDSIGEYGNGFFDEVVVEVNKALLACR